MLQFTLNRGRRKNRLIYSSVGYLLFISLVLSTLFYPLVSSVRADESFNSQTDTSLAHTSDNSNTNTSEETASDQNVYASPSSIETGDIDTHVEATTEVNTTDTGSETGDANTNSTTTAVSHADTEVAHINNATTSTVIGIDENSGNNTASTSSSSHIYSGDINTSVQATNLVNTNLVNTNWLIFYLSTIGDNKNILNLQEYFGRENIKNQNGDSKIQNTNNATTTNTISIDANTGQNKIDSENGEIATGNVSAGVNILNLINTNVIDSNFMVLFSNTLGNMNGDIILPGAAYFKSLFEKGKISQGQSDLTVTNSNETHVTNNISLKLNSGENTSVGGTIKTGDQKSSVEIVNELNQNYINTDSLAFLFNVGGNWSGNIFGLPQGFDIIKKGSGFEIAYIGEGSGNNLGYDDVDIENNNNAHLVNNIEMDLDTGKNTANGNIHTGNIDAAVNVVNIVNTNIIGKNWILALINVLGDWNGNVSFGAADLWIGARAEVQGSEADAGEEVIYHFTVANFGDADATEVKIKNTFSDALIELDDSPDGQFILPAGTIKAGESKEFNLTAKVKSDIPNGRTDITNHIYISTRVPELNLENNSELITITGFKGSPAQGGGQNQFPTQAEENIVELSHNPKNQDLKIEVQSNREKVRIGEVVDYKIIVINSGAPVYNTELQNVIMGESGNIVKVQKWSLGEIDRDEEVTIRFSMNIGRNMGPGIYNSLGVLRASDTPSGTVSTIEASGENKLTVLPEIILSDVGTLSLDRLADIAVFKKASLEIPEETETKTTRIQRTTKPAVSYTYANASFSDLGWQYIVLFTALFLASALLARQIIKK